MSKHQNRVRRATVDRTRRLALPGMAAAALAVIAAASVDRPDRAATADYVAVVAAPSAMPVDRVSGAVPFSGVIGNAALPQPIGRADVEVPGDVFSVTGAIEGAPLDEVAAANFAREMAGRRRIFNPADPALSNGESTRDVAVPSELLAP